MEDDPLRDLLSDEDEDDSDGGGDNRMGDRGKYEGSVTSLRKFKMVSKPISGSKSVVSPRGVGRGVSSRGENTDSLSRGVSPSEKASK